MVSPDTHIQGRPSAGRNPSGDQSGIIWRGQGSFFIIISLTIGIMCSGGS